ncbi:MAG: TraM recognition domain-containing protein, partial [Candidatus Aenigmatarchaeota archaeon]
KGRSANVWINFFTQSFSSIESVVGKELANVIVDNISTWLYMRVNCEETAERVSKSLPVVTRYNTKVVPGSEGATVILGENEESVYSPNVIMGLPNRHFILKKASGEYYVGETAFVEPPRIRVLPPQNISLIPTWGLDNHSVTSH